MPPLIEMRNIHKEFPGVKALSDVDFSLEQGEIHALLGENGAGKSTLIKVLTGAYPCESGGIRLDGKPIRPKSPFQAQHLGISTVYQEVNLCANLSVAENIYIGREPKRMGMIDWLKMKSDAKVLMRRFSLDIDVGQTLDHYSIAIQQMVAIARAVDISAKVLILDEPTSSLTVSEVNTLFATMRQLKTQGMGIIFVTHFLDQVYAVADRITVLRNGKLVGSYNTSELPRVQLVSKMIGKEYSEINELQMAKEDPGQRDVFLRAENITSRNSKHPMSFDVRQGEVLGLVGLLGSGRTEALNMLFAVDPIKSGELSIKKKDARLKAPIHAINHAIALCPENRKTQGLIGQLSIRDNIALALQSKRGMNKKISLREARELADVYINALQIKTPSQDQAVSKLSGGNQQKVILARWLATEPELLMLDEPTRGIDIGAKSEIAKIVADLSSKGMSIVFVSSEIDEELRSCERLLVLRDGEIACELTGVQMNEQVVMRAIAGIREGDEAHEAD